MDTLGMHILRPDTRDVVRRGRHEHIHFDSSQSGTLWILENVLISRGKWFPGKVLNRLCVTKVKEREARPFFVPDGQVARTLAGKMLKVTQDTTSEYEATNWPSGEITMLEINETRGIS